MQINDPAREFFVLAHSIIASEMPMPAAPRISAEPEDTDLMHFWQAWRTQRGFETRPQSKL
jgi:hypothetical protein